MSVLTPTINQVAGKLVKSQRFINKLLSTMVQTPQGVRELVRFLYAHPATTEDLGVQLSFSQSGEDLIVKFIFNALEIKHPTYIDVGAFDPYRYSNTAVFYLEGSKGINIDPNPEAVKLFEKERPLDTNLNIGLASKPGALKYYQMGAPTLNTFSLEAVEEYKKMGHRIVNEQQIEVEVLSEVISKHAKGIFPDFLSLDAEGFDMEILQTIDFEHNAPKVICIETISYSRTGHGKKDTQLIKFLTDRGYLAHSDTNINTIFVQTKLWYR